MAVRSTVPETFLGCVVSHPSYGARGRALGSAVVFLVLRGSFLFWNEKGALKKEKNVYGGSGYPEAAPLRAGSPWCHWHQRVCKGFTLLGKRCCITSSSAHEQAVAAADPLRAGMLFCAHHAAQAAPGICSTAVTPADHHPQ